jgi:hypothetical protein
MDIPQSLTPGESIPVSFEAFDADRADFERALEAIRQFQTAPVACLHDLEWVYEVDYPGEYLGIVVRIPGVKPAI